MSFDTQRGDKGFGSERPIGIFDAHHLTDDRPNAPAILRGPAGSDRPGHLPSWSPAAPRIPTGDTASGGLSHIYIIDSTATSRSALHTLMCSRSNTIVRTYGSPDAFLKGSGELDAGCVVICDEGVNGETASLITALKADGRFRFVVLTRHANIEIAIDVMKAGATDYIDQGADPVPLMMAVDEALGQVRQELALTAALDRARACIARLSARERDVLDGLVEGKSNKMIAIALNISPRTIEIYRAHLMEKLGTHSLSETLRIAFLAGIG